jgi:hypothetical protein
MIPPKEDLLRNDFAERLALGSAIVAEEWVAVHDLLGRNRPA